MKTVNHCVACGSKNVRTTPGMIAEFVVDRMLGEDSRKSPVDCNLITCEECEFVSTDVRFSEEEEARYYKNYLKDEYIDHRCSYDGEFLRELLTDVAKSTKYQNLRRAAMVQNLSEVIDLESIKSVMDFGGDTGKFIPKELSHADRYVYDIQLRRLPKGIKHLTNPGDAKPVDLVICTYVLEGLSDPNKAIKDMISFMHKGSWIYVEVPQESTTSPGFHERINRFTFNSLERLLASNGFENVKRFEIPYDHAIGKSFAVIAKLGKKK